MKNNNDNTLTKIYGGENTMTCSNEYNEKYLVSLFNKWAGIIGKITCSYKSFLISS